MERKLAELMGILSGDGYTNFYPPNKYFTEISGHLTEEKEYHEKYINPLLKETLGTTFRIRERKDQKARDLRSCKKEVHKKLIKMGFCKGKKKNNLKIPTWIKNKKANRVAFLKGLMDTDATFHIKNKKNIPTIALRGANHQLITTCNQWIKSFEIPTYCKKKKNSYFYKGEKREKDSTLLQISSLRGIHQFMKIIGFRNKKHLNKFNKWLNEKGHKYEIFKRETSKTNSDGSVAQR